MKQYESILKKLEQENILIRSSEFYDHVMGSWLIEISSAPPYRIVHDGRDKTIVLEIYKNEWKSIISDKTKSGKHVMLKLMNELKTS